MTVSTFIPAAAPLTSMLAGITSYAGHNCYVAAPEGSDAAELADAALAENSERAIPVDRLVIMTQQQPKPYELPSMTGYRLQQLAERFNITIEVKVAQAPYVHEFASAAARRQQASAGLMLAASMAYSIDALIEELASEDWQRIVTALEIITQIGTPARRTLRTILTLEVPDPAEGSAKLRGVRSEMAEAIEEVSGQSELLSAVVGATIHTAVEALYPRLSERREALMPLICDEFESVRWNTLDHLIKLLWDVLFPADIAWLEARGWSFEERICFARPIIGALIERMLHDTDPDIQERLQVYFVEQFDPNLLPATDADEERASQAFWVNMATALSAWINDPQLGKAASWFLAQARHINPYLAKQFSID